MTSSKADNSRDDRDRNVVGYSETYGERRSVDEQIQLRQQDPQFRQSQKDEQARDLRKLDRKQEERAFVRNLVNAFALGVKRCCARRMWASILKRLGVSPNDKDAWRYFGFSHPAQFEKYCSGGATYENVVVYMTEGNMRATDFDPLPSRADRAIAGYQVGVCGALDLEDPFPDDSALIDRNSCLVCLLVLGDPIWKRLRAGRRRKNELRDDEWALVAESCRSRRASIGALSIPEDCFEPANVKSVAMGWGNALATVREYVPFRWMPTETS